MSLGACIPELLASGKIRKADADKAERTYNRHYQALRGAMGDEAAAAEATTRALAELDHAAKLKRRQAGLAIRAQQRLDAAMDGGATKGINGHRTLVKSLKQVEDLREVIENGSHDNLYDFLQTHRRNKLGQPRNKTGLIDVVHELHGEATGNETAAALAKAVGDTFERLRLRFNRAGGDIASRADFGLPHRHDPLKVRQAGLPGWRDALLASIDPAKMIDPLTGGAFTPGRLDEFIEAAFKNISTNGLSELGGSGGLASRALANRRSDPRFFVFKSADAWLNYAKEFGDGNPFEAIMSHVHGMARDIAFMEKMGPNPAATWRRAIDRADRMAANSEVTHTGSINGTSRARARADKMWRYMNGDLTVPVVPEGDGFGAQAGRFGLSALHGTRDVLTAALLGSAQITSIADINTNAFARKFNGLPATNVLMGYLKQLNPLDAGHRRFAVYLGAGAKDASRTLAGLARWFGEQQGPRWGQVLADDVLRVTGMNKFFEAGRRSFIEDHFAQLGLERDKPYAELSEDRRAEFERHEITPDEWDVIRAAEPTNFRGVDYVDWHKIAETNPEIGDKLVGAVLRETRSAVLESDAASQSIVRVDRPGTFWGEMSANIFQFKSFPLALVMSQGERVAEINARKGMASAGTYAASFIVGMWLLGAVSLQAKQIVQGKDLRPVDDWDFWADAFVQGGGAGVVGDLIGSFKGDRVGGLAEYLGGPVVSFAEDVAKTGKSAFKKDKETGERGRKFGYQASRLARRYTPGTTIWYLRAALDRLLWDELQERIDLDYAEHQQRMQDAAQRQGQDYFYAPGDTLPHRAPELGEAPPQ